MGLYEARQARGDFKRLLIVEGYMDVVSAASGGHHLCRGHARHRNHPGAPEQDLPASPAKWCFASTAIAPAGKAAWRALENALPLARDGRELKFMFLPEGHDPDTLVAEEGRGSLRDPHEGGAAAVGVSGAAADRRCGSGSCRRPRKAQRPWQSRCLRACRRAFTGKCWRTGLASQVGMPAAKLKEFFAVGCEPSARRKRPGTTGSRSAVESASGEVIC